MLGFSSDVLLWIKALHIISVISWMAGLLYLPRLFVYHANAEIGGELSETLKAMEQKLLKFIMNPAMFASFLFGVLLLGNLDISVWVEIWLHAKLICLIGLTIFHFILIGWQKRFLNDNNLHSHKFYRFANEIPTALMVAIVVFVIVQPF